MKSAHKTLVNGGTICGHQKEGEYEQKDINDDGVSLFFEEYLMLNGFKPEETVLIDDSEDKGGTLSAYGINYRKINFGEGLEEELKDILQIITRP